MKRLLFAFIALVSFATFGATKLEDIRIRDPFVLVDNGQYYMYRTCDSVCADGKVRGGVEVFESKDLRKWDGPKTVMRIPDGNALTGTVWAPEVHKFNGKYFLLATINSDLQFKKSTDGWPSMTHRGTQIFRADSPEGPFEPFSQFTHTPQEQMALDGTLWVEEGKPYMVYCHEWVQTVDGTMELVELTPDLSETVGKPQVLFYGSAPEWSTGMKTTPGLPDGYITDGCFLYRTKSGKLLMIWSSFSNDKYAIGVSESVTGSVRGPWLHHPEPLFAQDGGHAMIFRDLKGDLRLIFHQPNNPWGAERARIFNLEDTGDSLILKSE